MKKLKTSSVQAAVLAAALALAAGGATGVQAAVISGTGASGALPLATDTGAAVEEIQYRGPYRGRPYAGPRAYGGPRYGGPRPFVGPRYVAPRTWGYRPWYGRPYYGTIVGGLALGTIIGVTAYGLAPRSPPRPDLCWYWADQVQSRGYWDYC